MNKRFNFAEKCFALCCKKNIPPWGTTKKTDLSREELIDLQRNEWQHFWERMDVHIPNFKNKVVVDYGCGFGYDSLFAMQSGAKHVYCLEVSQTRLKGARELHLLHGFDNATYLDNTNVEELPSKIDAGVDIIFSRDVMEHVPCPREVLDSMYRIAKPGGRIYIGFSPFYKSPYGPHFKNHCAIPWIHLIFSEQTILNVFKEKYGLDSSVNSYQEIEGSGVNKLSCYDYEKLLDGFDWRRESELTNRFHNSPLISKTLNLLVKAIPLNKVRELFVINSYISLQKSPTAAEARPTDSEEEVLMAGPVDA
ncbi:MAG: class I SAM-dependent methyltransferase [Pirellulales bacterium]|nr:class I SAM-dependent methyltransferase [Pirellulales bacterium]